MKQPTQLDLRAVLESAHSSTETHPDLWKAALERALVPDTEWHGGEWQGWHASQLDGCPRASVLKRAGLATDGRTLESNQTLMLGSFWHSMVQFGLEQCGLYDDVRCEQGGTLWPDINLAGRSDIVWKHDGDWLIGDIKTEKDMAGARRRADAERLGLSSSARPAHALQMAAYAEILEALDPDYSFAGGWVLYVAKMTGDIDQQWVEFTPELRDKVHMRVCMLDEMWAAYEFNEALPEKVADKEKLWMCSPRSATNFRGLWCEARRTCFGCADG